MLCNLLFGEIKKFEFQIFCIKSLEKGEMALTFAYDVGKKRIILTFAYPVSQFLDSQNFKWKYESRNILVFARNLGFFIS
jgi:hypothetical protein